MFHCPERVCRLTVPKRVQENFAKESIAQFAIAGVCGVSTLTFELLVVRSILIVTRSCLDFSALEINGQVCLS